MVPKAHYALHMGEQLKAHGLLLTCFVHERRHKECKRFANQMSTGVPSGENWIPYPADLSISFAAHLRIVMLEHM